MENTRSEMNTKRREETMKYDKKICTTKFS